MPIYRITALHFGSRVQHVMTVHAPDGTTAIAINTARLEAAWAIGALTTLTPRTQIAKRIEECPTCKSLQRDCGARAGETFASPEALA